MTENNNFQSFGQIIPRFTDYERTNYQRMRLASAILPLIHTI